MTKECSHTKTKEVYVEDKYEDWYSGEEVNDSYWESKTESTFEDIDLHRYMCTQCNKIFYYSEKARKFFEEGIGSL